MEICAHAPPIVLRSGLHPAIDPSSIVARRTKPDEECWGVALMRAAAAHGCRVAKSALLVEEVKKARENCAGN